MSCGKEEDARKKNFANVLNVKLNYRAKFQEIDGLLCCWVVINTWSFGELCLRFYEQFLKALIVVFFAAGNM